MHLYSPFCERCADWIQNEGKSPADPRGCRRVERSPPDPADPADPAEGVSRRSRRIIKEDQRKSAKSAGEILFENTDSQIQVEDKSPADPAEGKGLPQIAQIPQRGRVSR